MSYNYPSPYQSPTSPYHRWDERERQYNKEELNLRQHSYPTPPPSASSRTFSPTNAASPRRFQRPQRSRWPPQPCVEDEAKSLSKERNPSVSSDDVVPLKGSVDQHPVIIPADASSGDESWEDSQKDGLRRSESSSTDSSAPKTPTESSRNDERRFVLLSQGNVKHDEPEDHVLDEEERRGSYVRLRPDQHVQPLRPRSKSPAARSGLRIDPILNDVKWDSKQQQDIKKDDPIPYTGPRESTRYAFSPNVNKGVHALDSLKSPENITPIGSPNLRGRQFDLRFQDRPEKQRTFSGSSTFPGQKAVPPRHMSAMGLMRENTRSSSFEPDRKSGLEAPIATRDFARNSSPLGNASKSRPAIDSDSEYTDSDSNISPDEISPPRRRKRHENLPDNYNNSRTSFGTCETDNGRKQRPEPIQTGRLSQDQPPGLTSRHDAAPTYLPKSPSSTSVHSAGRSQEMLQKAPDHLIRQEALRSPYRPPPPSSPNRDPNKPYFTSADLPASLARPGSRPNSRPNSRPSTPPYSRSPHATPSQSRKGTLDVPQASQPRPFNTQSQGHHPSLVPSTPSSTPPSHTYMDQHIAPRESHRHDTASRPRQTSPLPVAGGGKVQAIDGPIYSEPQQIDTKSQVFSPTNPKTRSRASSNVPSPGPIHHSPVPIHHSPVQSSAVPQTPRSGSTHTDNLGRRGTDSQHSRMSSGSVPRSPVLFKPTLRKRAAVNNPKLPLCPRPRYVEGYTDWSTLPNHPYFDVCPTCRKALEEGGFTDQFVPSSKRSVEYPTRCDLSNVWIRMAWLLLLQDKAKDRLIANNITTIHYQELPCPGRELSSRNWHRLLDPESGRYVSNFAACPSCVRSLEQLFPNLKGTLRPAPTPTDPNDRHANDRTCDLRPESHRFATYVDLLENISTHAAEHRREPNMHRFIGLARKMAGIRECRRDDQLMNAAWHYPRDTPDFTVCEECYAAVVYPALSTVPSSSSSSHTTAGAAAAAPENHPAAMFGRSLQPLPPHFAGVGLSCQLYSKRMREAFWEALKKGDARGLRETAVQRVKKERELQRKHRDIQSLEDDDERVKEGRRLVKEWSRWE